MTPRAWRSLYLPHVATTLLVCLVFARIIGQLHLAVVAVLGILISLGLAWLGGRLTQEIEPPVHKLGEAAYPFPWFAPVLFCLACAKFTTLGLLSSGFVPSLHDEWSYMFGAQTFALGRLTNSPPAQPEFFDAFHILCTPRWVTRYPPGHPAVLALGVLVGWPSAAIIAMTAGTVVWIYFLAREFGGEPVGKLAGVVALFAPGLDFLASGYLSQSTFLFAITGCYVCAAWSWPRGGIGAAAAAGTLGGWAILTRPYSAVALGIPLAAWFAWQVLRRVRGAAAGAAEAPRGIGRESQVVSVWLTLFAAALPLFAALVLFAAYNMTTTESPWRIAWGEYNRQFEPDNTLGFSNGSIRSIPADLNARKALKAKTIAQEKLEFTWVEALLRAVADPRRLSEMIFPALGFYGLITFLPFGLRGTRPSGSSSRRLAGGLLVAAPVAHYLAYSFFYSKWGVYGHETIPFFVVLIANGLVTFWRRGRDSDRPGIAIVVPLALVVALGLDVREFGGSIDKRKQETKRCRDFLDKLEEIADQPSIVFVRPDAKRSLQSDLIHNRPDLGGPTVVVLDRGEENTKLLESFPGRRAYLFDEVTGKWSPWPPTRVDVPARLPTPRPPRAATWPVATRDR